jgi:hypothetical protein
VQRPTISLSSPSVPRAHAFIAILTVWLFLTPGRARAGSPQAPPTNSAIPAQTTTASAVAQNTPPAADAASENPSPAKKSKKVWTNEEVSGIGGPISVIGEGRDTKNKTVPQKAADPQYISNVRKQLASLQSQLAAADKELATLKNFNDGESVSTSDREFHKGYNSQPILQQMTHLETKKKDLQSKIDALLDEARKKGVEPGQLR